MRGAGSISSAWKGCEGGAAGAAPGRLPRGARRESSAPTSVGDRREVRPGLVEWPAPAGTLPSGTEEAPRPPPAALGPTTTGDGPATPSRALGPRAGCGTSPRHRREVPVHRGNVPGHRRDLPRYAGKFLRHCGAVRGTAGTFRGTPGSSRGTAGPSGAPPEGPAVRLEHPAAPPERPAERLEGPAAPPEGPATPLERSAAPPGLPGGPPWPGGRVARPVRALAGPGRRPRPSLACHPGEAGRKEDVSPGSSPLHEACRLVVQPATPC